MSKRIIDLGHNPDEQAIDAARATLDRASQRDRRGRIVAQALDAGLGAEIHSCQIVFKGPGGWIVVAPNLECAEQFLRGYSCGASDVLAYTRETRRVAEQPVPEPAAKSRWAVIADDDDGFIEWFDERSDAVQLAESCNNHGNSAHVERVDTVREA